MSIPSTLSLIAFIIELALGIYILSKNNENKTNKLFSYMLLASSIICLAEYHTRIADSYSTALFWKIIDSLWPIRSIILYQFALAYTNKIIVGKNNRQDMGNQLLLYGSSAAIIISYLILLKQATLAEESWGWIIQFPQNINLQLLVILGWALFISLTVAAILFIDLIKMPQGRRKQQTKLVFFGLIIPLIGSIITEIILPVLGKPVPELTNTLFVFTAAFFVYAMHKYELFVLTPEKAALRIVETMDDAFFLVDPHGIIRSTNKAATKLFKRPRDGLLNNSIYKFVAIAQRKELEEKLSTEDFHDKTVHLVDAKGNKIVVSASSTTLNYQRDNMEGSIIILRDMKERMRTETQLIKFSKKISENSKLKDLFIDILRHDILNPVTVIKGGVEILEKEKKSKSQRRVIDLIKKNIVYTESIVASAQEYAKIEACEKLEKKNIDIYKMLKTVCDEVQPRFHKAGMRLANKVKKPLLLPANPLLHEVFLNLLTNAEKYAKEGKKVEIEATTSKQWCTIQFIDHGEGIPDQYKESIFTRLKRREKEGVKGTGLGLAIVKKIIELHGGTIHVEDNPKGGAIFVVMLPRTRRTTIPSPRKA